MCDELCRFVNKEEQSVSLDDSRRKRVRNGRVVVLDYSQLHKKP